MKKKYSESIIEAAKKFDTTPEKIVEDIGIAIENARNSLDPKTQAFWNSVPKKEKELTTEEMIDYILNLYFKQGKH